MVDPIRFNTSQSVYWPDIYEPIAVKDPSAKEDRQGAEAEVASLYYQSSLQSLSTPGQEAHESNRHSISAAQEVRKERSLIQKIGDWIWSLFGKEQTDEEELNKERPQDQNVINSINHVPQLEPPTRRDDQKLVQFVSELNSILDKQLKEMAEFEEEMRRASSKQLDKLIFKELVACGLVQKQFKEHFSILAQDELMQLYKRNKELQKTHYSLLDDINKRARTNKVLHWVDIGTTVGITGVLGAVLVTSGGMAALSFAVPILSLMKGGTTLSKGILEHQNDRDTGNLFLVNQETKLNSSHMHDKLSTMQETTGEIGEILKTIREHLKNQSHAERIFNPNS